MGKSLRGADASMSTGTADLLIAVHPFGVPSARFAAAATRAGALGVLDLTSGNRAAREELDLAESLLETGFGVRVAGPAELPLAVHTVLLAAGTALSTVDFGDRRVLTEVTSRDEAIRAVAAGADGVIARGHEAGGRIGELGTFVFLQQLLADPAIGVPVWAYGGIGVHTAAAAVAGGTAGVMLDTAFALLPETELPSDVTMALEGLDGSETIVDGGIRGLRRRPDLEVGQDAFLPQRFRDTWGTLPAAIRAVHASIIGGLFASGGALPLAQGPMTRVSDQPEFAGAVAAGGALPFLALALSGPAQTREMLEKTKATLGDAPWGVGVLGFAAEEVCAAQLEVIREVRPSHAIIAGGRPAQAKALEDAGISTFLHVPSPGLLRQFLEAGARKFVFEGAECGGHVGPRASFPLWEAQIGVLLEYAGEIEVYFAGGVHDERSAAMVAAAAAPLTRLGATVGLLKGTAYLFTEEAVRAGAILPLFQRQVVEATRTDLLETAPGHATRCVRSAFTGEEPDIATAKTTAELRAALIGSGLAKPAEIERTIRIIEGEREVRGTLRRIGALGSPVRYHSVDMLDAEAVHRAVKEIHAEHGRIDGIVYAAGVIEDKLIADKDPASFNRVFGTKVEGASTLLAAAGELPEAPKFAVLFGSVAATLGNRGQSDYAAANDALEALGHRWATVYGRRGLTVHWGPWAPTGVNNGMVTPELMRDYARRGIELIDPEEGTLSLLRELAWGDEDLTAVTYTASGW